MLAPGRVGDPASARALARPYRDVAARLTEWIDQGRAIEDLSEAIYLHEYTSGGITIRGLVGTLDVSRRTLSPTERAVWPHEAIHLEQAGELADRMFQMRLNPAPILLVHHGTQSLRDLMDVIAHQDPDWTYLDRTAQRQRIWAIRSATVLDEISTHLASAHCLLADGHHRYAAYLRLQEEHTGIPWDGGLAMIVDQSDTPLFLGAIHRTLEGTSMDQLTSAAQGIGATVHECTKPLALAHLDREHLVLTDGTRWCTVRPPHLEDRTLVTWLHEGLLTALEVAPTAIAHHHSVDKTLERASRSAPAVLLPTPDFSQVLALIEGGGLLPEKATSFQPKPSLGVLMRPVPAE